VGRSRRRSGEGVIESGRGGETRGGGEKENDYENEKEGENDERGTGPMGNTGTGREFRGENKNGCWRLAPRGTVTNAVGFRGRRRASALGSTRST